MTERRAITLATFLGIIVLALILVVCRPFTWGRESEIAVTGTAVSGDSVSAGASDQVDSGGSNTAGDTAVDRTRTTITYKNASGSSVTETFELDLDSTVSGSAVVSGAVVNAEKGNILLTRFQVPEGYTRVPADEESLGTFLRTYPLKKAGAKVKLFDGSDKTNQSAHAAVFKFPLAGEELQQCADSVMRVYAEYFWQTGQYDRIAFHFVDGFLAEYSKWRKGKRIQVGMGETAWIDGGKEDKSYEAFAKFMRIVYAYASTISLKNESKSISLKKIQIGDIFIKAGSPGHVVMVVDVCENADGKKAFLLAQGYTPAQQFHVLKNPAHEEDPWYYQEEIKYPLKTPEYTFEKGSLMHPEY